MKQEEQEVEEAKKHCSNCSQFLRFFYYNSNSARLVFSNCILNDVPRPERDGTTTNKRIQFR